MNKGRVYIISGPSGSGKDTVLKKIFEKCPQVAFSISSITRPMREGEVEGEKYNFVTREHFEEMIANDQLLEHNVFVGNYYGTPKDYVEQQMEAGRDVILEIEIQGAMKVKEQFPNAILLFVMPPSIAELHQRLVGRGTETEEVIMERLLRAYEEAVGIEEYDYIIINDDLDACVKELHELLTKSHEEIQTQYHPNNYVELIEDIRTQLKGLVKGEK